MFTSLRDGAAPRGGRGAPVPPCGAEGVGDDGEQGGRPGPGGGARREPGTRTYGAPGKRWGQRLVEDRDRHGRLVVLPVADSRTGSNRGETPRRPAAVTRDSDFRPRSTARSIVWAGLPRERPRPWPAGSAAVPPVAPPAGARLGRRSCPGTSRPRIVGAARPRRSRSRARSRVSGCRVTCDLSIVAGERMADGDGARRGDDRIQATTGCAGSGRTGFAGTRAVPGSPVLTGTRASLGYRVVRRPPGPRPTPT